MTSDLAYIKCQVIFYNTARDEMWYSSSFEILSFYFPPLELVHRVDRGEEGSKREEEGDEGVKR